MSQRKSSYVATPQAEPETLPRLAAVVAVMAGHKTVSQAARELGVARNHFQTLLHRAEAQLIESVRRKPGGRPSRVEELVIKQQELKQLRKQNLRLQKQVAATEELLAVAGGLLRGRLRPKTRGRRPRKSAPSIRHEPAESEPDGCRVQTLAGVEQMQRLGLTRGAAARVSGWDPATLRRWRARQGLGKRVVSTAAAMQAEQLLRELHGLVGAASLAHSVQGLSRRQAAGLKADLLTRMERERKAALTRVHVAQPGVLRGLDAMHVATEAGPMHALISADGAIPYRTMLVCAEHYDTRLVMKLLEADLCQHGAPLVLRLDRASCHDVPEVRQLLDRHGVLVLHGPAHHPGYYGQLERQNREHRMWLRGLPRMTPEQLQECLRQMLEAVNQLWRRRTLQWRSSEQAWNERPPIRVDRSALREEVQARARRIAQEGRSSGLSADLAERLAIERTLERMGLLRLQPGGWC